MAEIHVLMLCSFLMGYLSNPIQLKQMAETTAGIAGLRTIKSQLLMQVSADQALQRLSFSSESGRRIWTDFTRFAPGSPSDCPGQWCSCAGS